MKQPEEILKIESVSVSYGSTLALGKVTAQLHSGMMTAIIGPNGTGKSSLVKAIFGLVPYEGKISVWSKPVQEVFSRMAYVPQRSQVDWKYPATVQEVVEMGRYQPGSWKFRLSPSDKSAVSEALDQAGISSLSKRMIGELSGGQQQRVFIARALARQADFYLMDEPFAGVDIQSEEKIVSILQQLNQDGKTLLIVNHNLEQVRNHFSQVWALSPSGIQIGHPQEILSPKVV
jgi:ABC-type Mn2+/Zn2+ transport system ATPase subunit